MGLVVVVRADPAARDQMRPDSHLREDAKGGAATATKRFVEGCIACAIRRDDGAICEHDLSLDEVVCPIAEERDEGAMTAAKGPSR